MIKKVLSIVAILSLLATCAWATTTTTTHYALPKPPLKTVGIADGYSTLLDTADTNLYNAITATLLKSLGTGPGVLIGFSAAGVPGTLEPGADGDFVQRDSASPLGIKWYTPPAWPLGWTNIAKVAGTDAPAHKATPVGADFLYMGNSASSNAHSYATFTETIAALGLLTALPAHTHKTIQDHGFAMVDAVDARTIPGFFVKLGTGETAKLLGARYKLSGGTSIAAKVTINGSDATGLTGISVTPTAAETMPTAITLANNDFIAVVTSSPSGSPLNLSFTVFVEKTKAVD